jgi:transposase
MTKSKRVRRAFEPEFKREAVRLYDERRAAGVPVSRIAHDLGVRPRQVREWAQQQRAAETTAPSPTGETPEQELRRLRRENKQLRLEVEFAKKAAAYFARESQ